MEDIIKVTKLTKIRDHPTNIDDNETNKKIYFDYLGQDCFLKIQLLDDYFYFNIECNIENKVYRSEKIEISKLKMDERISINLLYDLIIKSCSLEIYIEKPFINFSKVKFIFQIKNRSKISNFEILTQFTLSKSKSHSFFENKIKKLLHNESMKNNDFIYVENRNNNNYFDKKNKDDNIENNNSDDSDIKNNNLLTSHQNKITFQNQNESIKIKQNGIGSDDSKKHSLKQKNLKDLKDKENINKIIKKVNFEKSPKSENEMIKRKFSKDSKSREDDGVKFKNIALKSVSPQEKFNPLSLRHSMTQSSLNKFTSKNNVNFENKYYLDELKLNIEKISTELDIIKQDLKNIYQSQIDLKVEFDTQLNKKIKLYESKLNTEIASVLSSNLEEIKMKDKKLEDKVENIFYEISEKLVNLEAKLKEGGNVKSENFKSIHLNILKSFSSKIENENENNFNLFNKENVKSEIEKIEYLGDDNNIIEGDVNIEKRITVSRPTLKYKIDIKKFKNNKLSNLSCIIAFENLLLFSNSNNLYMCNVREGIMIKLNTNFKQTITYLLKDGSYIFIAFSNGDIFRTKFDNSQKNKEYSLNLTKRLNDCNKEITYLEKSSNFLFAAIINGELLCYVEDKESYNMYFRTKLFGSRIIKMIANDNLLFSISNSELISYKYLTEDTNVLSSNLHVGNIIDLICFSKTNLLITSGEDGNIKSWKKDKIEFDQTIFLKNQSKFNIFEIDNINLGAFDLNNSILYVFRFNSERLFLLEKSFRFEHLILNKIIVLQDYKFSMISQDGVISQISFT